MIYIFVIALCFSLEKLFSCFEEDVQEFTGFTFIRLILSIIATAVSFILIVLEIVNG